MANLFYYRQYRLIKAFKEVFCDEKGNLKPAAKQVLAYLRDECNAKGALGDGGVPFFYDANNRFDVNAAVFAMGKRRVFDIMIKYLSLDENEVFRLRVVDEDRNAALEKDLMI